MNTVVLIKDGNSSGITEDIAALAAKGIAPSLIVVEESGGEDVVGTTAPVITLDALSPSELAQFSDRGYTFIHSYLVRRADSMNEIASFLTSAEATMNFSIIEIGDDEVTFPGMGRDGIEFDRIITEYQPGMFVPAMLASASSSVVVLATSLKHRSIPSLMIGLYTAALTLSEKIESKGNSCKLPFEVGTLLRLDDAAAAESLKQLIAGCNIEELFPHSPWNGHEQECGATSYHSIAAKLIQFGDLAGASECIDHSERLHDSPRAQALRAIIAERKGETFGALGKMVASLQHYELRKKAQNGHYLHFIPKNLELINDELHAGLEALNSRDEKDALDHFTKAVFEFDSFYKDQGFEE